MTVNLAGTATLATIYSSNAYAALANPFTSDSDGTYEWYGADARYDVVLVKAGFTFPAANASDLLLSDRMSVVSPAQITATQNDYSPTNGANVATWRLASDAARTITGIVAPASAAGERNLTLINVGAFVLTLSHNSGSSTAGNRFTFPRSRDVVLLPNESLKLYYDATTTAWLAERVPDRRVLTVTTTDSATLTNSVVETTMFTFTVPGGVVGSSRMLLVTVYGKVTNNSGVGTILSLRHRYGGSSLAFTSSTTNFNFSDMSIVARCVVAGDGATNAQYGTMSVDHVGAVTAFTATSAGRGTAVIDSTADQTFLFAALWNAASAFLSYTTEYVIVEIVP